MRKVLVTGGLGFIGAHLVNSLIKRNEIINLSSGQTYTVKKTNQRDHFCPLVKKKHKIVISKGTPGRL